MLEKAKSSTRSFWSFFTFMLLVMLWAGNANAMTYRDNEVRMPLNVTGYGIVSASYTITEHSVTSGQDPEGRIYDGLSKSFTGNNGSMTFSVGRSGSSSVANWFKNRIPSYRTTFNHDPGKLNFAFIGTLKLTLTGGKLGSNRDTYVIQDAAIAQGHTAARNNWWFGGKSCNHESGNKVTCQATSTSGYGVKFTFYRGGNSVNEIAITAIDYPAYTVTRLQSQYVGENYRCVWQQSKCPPFVMYYTNSQADGVKLTVKNNLLYDSTGKLFDTTNADPSHSGRAAIFVMNSDGGVYASNAHVVYLFHHSTILAGGPVTGAGELVVKEGVVQRMTNCSGHYRPADSIFLQVKESLYRQGYTRTIPTQSCSSLKLTMDLDYQPVPQPLPEQAAP